MSPCFRLVRDQCIVTSDSALKVKIVASLLMLPIPTVKVRKPWRNSHERYRYKLHEPILVGIVLDTVHAMGVRKKLMERVTEHIIMESALESVPSNQQKKSWSYQPHAD
jgi:hypothetical protein